MSDEGEELRGVLAGGAHEPGAEGCGGEEADVFEDEGEGVAGPVAALELEA